jgi:hypothetical protein
MPHPPGTHLRHRLHLRRALYSVADVRKNGRVNPI